jgi:4'-phosphopantetheinyl transferase EntD
MFEMFKPKEETPKMPTFEELKMALPEELRDEFQKLGADVEKIARAKGGAMDGNEVEDEILSDEEKRIFARHGELQKMAMDKLQSK